MFEKLYYFVFFFIWTDWLSVNITKIYGAQQKRPYFENLMALGPNFSVKGYFRTGVVWIDIHMILLPTFM